ncbi:MAG: Tyrosine-protein kinase Wzc, partial [Phycisphaerales bacterium]|nr:Tyrosine-protein kinase Wzc [Phycisphaerales bacterium]
MNNLSTQLGQRNVPPGAMDVWNQGQMPQQLGMPSPHQAQPAASPVAMVQKLLRGRVALAIVLALIGAIIGAGAGYMSQAPTYKSSGVLLISPLIPMVEGDKAMPYYQQMMTTQVYTIVSPQIINEVPKTEPWKSVVGKNNDALADLGANLKPTYTRNTFVINLDYANPDQKIAQAGVQTVIAVYRAQFQKNAGNNIASKLEEQRKRKQDLDDKYATADGLILDVTRTYGSPDLQNLVTAAQNKVEAIDRELRVNENQYKNATDAIVSRRDGNGKLSTSELAATQPILAKMINDLREAQAATQLDEKLLGPNHQKVRSEKVALQVRQDAIESLA